MNLKDHSIRGVSHVIVIIVVALSFIGLASMILTSGMLQTVEEKISKENKAVKKIEDKQRDVEYFLLKVSPLIMTGETNYKITVEAVSKYLDEKKKSYTLMGREPMIENIVYESMEKLFTSGHKITRSDYEKKTSEKEEAQLKEFQEEIVRSKNAYLAELRQKKEEMLNKKSKENEKYLLLKDQLNNDKKIKEEKLPGITDKFKKDTIRLENEVSIAKYALEDLASKEAYNRDIIEVYGKIFNPDMKNRLAFITIGSKDGVRVGSKFMAYRQQQGFIRKWKGQIEVKRVFDIYSLASITRMEKEDEPITDGDYITNIFYHPKHSRTVVLIGKFRRGPFKYDREEIEQRLIDMGATVEKKVTLKTDFALIGDDPEERDMDKENFTWVRRLNIPRVESDEAKKSLQYYLGD
ncbi:MAG: hypothetical protein HZA49_04350 [Planctomycetes bacterium]|nr:hypothetical protein [Planctomycetota bacterium]